MLLEQFDLADHARLVHILFGLGLGVIFGIAAQISRFCLRRAVAGDEGERGSALSVWLMGFAVAVGGFALAQSYGLVDLTGHRFLSANVPVLAIALGGLLFGAGMVLTRGCISRLTVLSATGNLRAVAVIALFAIVAHATMKGILAPLRVSLSEFSVALPLTSFGDITGVAPAVAAVLFATAIWLARQSGAKARNLILGAVIGLVAVAGWVGTSMLFLDEFDPLPVQTAAFTLPWTDTLFWTIASTALPAGFGVGFVGGVLAGSFASAALRRELKFHSFEDAGQTVRYVAGGAMMGFGGVLAGGCTVGAGLSGGAALSVSALIALGAMIAGGLLTRQVLVGRSLPATA